MEKKERTYIAIDLKSFYASVECIERSLDPMTTNLVVADASRTEKTICLAVSPSLKRHGIPGRARLFEVVAKLKEANRAREYKAPGRSFSGSSFSDTELKRHPELKIDYIAAPPRMALYIKYSTRIYNVYLRYISPDDIHVYSIDEVFIDATDYLKIYKLTARELAMKMILDVLEETGITATAGIGTNLYLAKVAMDIKAKHIAADENGVRIAELDEMSYRKELWNHRPLTDFWRVGRGYASKLEARGIFTMGDIARCSVGKSYQVNNEDLLYKLFGVNAELLIDHAWGYEPCTMKDIKAYRPEASSLGSGQVLHCPYSFNEARIIVREMAELLSLDLVDKRMVSDTFVLTVGYDIDNLKDPERRYSYKGEITTDPYGRQIPKHAHGTAKVKYKTSSSSEIVEAFVELYEKIVDKSLLVRRVNIAACNIIEEASIADAAPVQLDLFTDYEEEKRIEEERSDKLKKERSIQEATLNIKKAFGKNAILKGTNLQEAATTMDRNKQIGGHKA